MSIEMDREAENRRSFMITLAAGSVAMLTACGGGARQGVGQGVGQGVRQEPSIDWEQVKLGPGGEILSVPENRALIARIENAPDLTPEKLFQVAAQFRDNPSTWALGQRVAANAMATIVTNQAVSRAIETIARTEVPWSLFGDIWDAVKNFFTGGTDQKDPRRCKYRCLGAALIEKCGPNDAWHIIGMCMGFKW